MWEAGAEGRKEGGWETGRRGREGRKGVRDREYSVPDPDKGVCADPVNGGALLGKGGPEPQGGNKERQLSPEKGRVKT